MRRPWLAAACIGVVCVALGLQARADSQSLGVGVHYWKTVDTIDVKNIDDSGLSYLASYQIGPDSLIKIEGDLEIFPDGFAGATQTTYAPQAFVLLGKLIYAGVGIGVNYVDGEFANDPFYILRAGLDLNLFPHLHLDVNGNYEFTKWESKSFDTINTDTVTLGAAVRLSF